MVKKYCKKPVTIEAILYDGTNKVIKSLKKEKYPIFIINIKEYEDNSSDRQQINKVVIKYVLDNYKLITTKGEYVIYGEG